MLFITSLFLLFFTLDNENDPSRTALDSFFNSIELEYSDSVLPPFQESIVYDRTLNHDGKLYIRTLREALNNIDSLNLDENTVADIHYHISEKIYMLLGGPPALEYFERLQPSEGTLLATHQDFLTALVHSNDRSTPEESIQTLIDLEAEYSQRSHPNIIRLYNMLGFLKKNNNYASEAEKFYKMGLAASNQYPNHKTISVLHVNYLYFLILHDLHHSSGLSKRDILNMIENLENDTDAIYEIIGRSLRLYYARYLELPENEIQQHINESNARIKVLNMYNENFSSFILAEFLLAVAKYHLNKEVPDHEKAMPFLNKTIKELENSEYKNLQLLIISKKIKAKSHHHLNENSKAYKIQNEIDSLSSIYFNEQKAKALAHLTSSFDVKRTKLENVALQEKNKKLNFMLFSSLFFVLIFSVISLILYSLHSSNKKLNDELKQIALKFKNTNVNLNQVNHRNLELIEKLNLSNTYLNNFASIAAHDLKSPIRTISSFTGLIFMRYKDVMDKKHLDWINFIVTDLKRLSAMVDDVLRFSNMTSESNLEKHDIDLNEMLEVVKTNLKSEMEGKKIQFRVPRPLPTIKSFNSLVFQLFINVIGNSVKYSKASETNIITFLCEVIDNNKIQLSIKDTGIGISKENQNNVLNMYTSIHEDKEIQYSGQGIGLATCQRIVKFLNGHIEINSEKDIGTEVILTFQVDKIQELSPISA